MFTVELDPEREQQLRRLAASRQQEVSQLVRRLLEEFLDVQSWGEDSEEDWARASVSMAAKFLPPESWEEDDATDEPR